MILRVYTLTVFMYVYVLINMHIQIYTLTPPPHTHTCTHTHFDQLKNMVSALFQSRPSDRGGTRCFSSKGCEFGWMVIENMYHREISRIREGKCSRIPKLKESHILRDSWTRLNVLPSKIMQVNNSV